MRNTIFIIMAAAFVSFMMPAARAGSFTPQVFATGSAIRSQPSWCGLREFCQCAGAGFTVCRAFGCAPLRRNRAAEATLR